MQKIISIENAAFGGLVADAEAGYGLQGPVSANKGEIEYRRLAAVLTSLRQKGYERTRGDINVQVLQRGSEFRYRIVHGHHRAAAMAALGFEHIPAYPNMLLDMAAAPHWPQVYRGPWSVEQARSYFLHHFDFDSKNWARQLALTPR